MVVGAIGRPGLHVVTDNRKGTGLDVVIILKRPMEVAPVHQKNDLNLKHVTAALSKSVQSKLDHPQVEESMYVCKMSEVVQWMESGLTGGNGLLVARSVEDSRAGSGPAVFLSPPM